MRKFIITLTVIFALILISLISCIILKCPASYVSEEPIIMQTPVKRFSDIVMWVEREYNMNNMLLSTCFVNAQYPDYSTDIKITYCLIDTDSGNKRYPYKIYWIEYNYTKNIINEVSFYYTDRIHTDGIDIKQLDVNIEDVLRKYPAEMELFYYDIDFSKKMSISKRVNCWEYYFYDSYDNRISLYYPPK